MGRKKKDPGKTLQYMNCGFYAEELHAIDQIVGALGVSRLAAVRILVRAGADTDAVRQLIARAGGPRPTFTAEGD